MKTLRTANAPLLRADEDDLIPQEPIRAKPAQDRKSKQHPEGVIRVRIVATGVTPPERIKDRLGRFVSYVCRGHHRRRAADYTPGQLTDYWPAFKAFVDPRGDHTLQLSARQVYDEQSFVRYNYWRRTGDAICQWIGETPKCIRPFKKESAQ